jgi:hypothetical protein
MSIDARLKSMALKQAAQRVAREGKTMARFGFPDAALLFRNHARQLMALRNEIEE